jgi:hypothetical protein
MPRKQSRDIVAYAYEDAVWCPVCTEVNYLSNGMKVDIDGNKIEPIYAIDVDAKMKSPKYACQGCLRIMDGARRWITLDKLNVIV